jgi:hypothetical protein
MGFDVKPITFGLVHSRSLLTAITLRLWTREREQSYTGLAFVFLSIPHRSERGIELLAAGRRPKVVRRSELLFCIVDNNSWT